MSMKPIKYPKTKIGEITLTHRSEPFQSELSKRINDKMYSLDKGSFLFIDTLTDTQTLQKVLEPMTDMTEEEFLQLVGDMVKEGKKSGVGVSFFTHLRRRSIIMMTNFKNEVEHFICSTERGEVS